jgi:hypothetical protein
MDVLNGDRLVPKARLYPIRSQVLEVDEIICKESKDPDHPNSCGICLDTFEEADPKDRVGGPRRIIVLGCGHVFHSDCIGEWVKKVRKDDRGQPMPPSCPMCLQKITPIKDPKYEEAVNWTREYVISCFQRRNSSPLPWTYHSIPDEYRYGVIKKKLDSIDAKSKPWSPRSEPEIDIDTSTWLRRRATLKGRRKMAAFYQAVLWREEALRDACPSLNPKSKDIIAADILIMNNHVKSFSKSKFGRLDDEQDPRLWECRNNWFLAIAIDADTLTDESIKGYPQCQDLNAELPISRYCVRLFKYYTRAELLCRLGLIQRPAADVGFVGLKRMGLIETGTSRDAPEVTSDVWETSTFIRWIFCGDLIDGIDNDHPAVKAYKWMQAQIGKLADKFPVFKIDPGYLTLDSACESPNAPFLYRRVDDEKDESKPPTPCVEIFLNGHKDPVEGGAAAPALRPALRPALAAALAALSILVAVAI